MSEALLWLLVLLLDPALACFGSGLALSSFASSTLLCLHSPGTGTPKPWGEMTRVVGSALGIPHAWQQIGISHSAGRGPCLDNAFQVIQAQILGSVESDAGCNSVLESVCLPGTLQALGFIPRTKRKEKKERAESQRPQAGASAHIAPRNVEAQFIPTQGGPVML